LDPEILFVDEVLAVGDLAFQKKCLGKIGDVVRQGRTILFVSHNMGAIRSLCDRGIVLDEGRVHSSGDISTAIAAYHQLLASSERMEPERAKAKGFEIGPVTLAGRDSCTVDQSEEAEITTELRFYDPIPGFTLLCILDDMQQRRIFHMRQDSSEFGSGMTWQGSYRLTVKLPPLWLEPGLYSLYFKALPWGRDAAARHMSDVLHLDVSGHCCGWGSMISPRREWSVQPVVPSGSENCEP
jgi:lipopolysaccharide transport system ATP-binding protein